MKPRDIKKLRLRLGLAQADLGKLVGANQATVSKWETGTIAVSRMASRALEQVDQLATKWDARKALKQLDQEAA